MADAEKAIFGPVWLVPSVIFAQKARPAGARQNLRFSASTSETTGDQWRPFRYERGQLADRILELLEESDR